MNEQPVVFDCKGASLVGILSRPNFTKEKRVGILITVGGPQYRVGSHRQFVMLARFLAQKGYTVLRFDYRGMGDSCGPQISFEEAGPDINAAIEILLKKVPSLKKIVLWGLCDAASINLIQGFNDPRVNGLVLLNPWIRTEEGHAQTQLKHYYLQKIFSKSLWLRIISNKVNLRQAFKEIFQKVMLIIKTATPCSNDLKTLSLPDHFEKCFQAFKGNILLIISGNDLTAAEFIDRVMASPSWKQRIDVDERINQFVMEDADHTFSKQVWKTQVCWVTYEWLESIDQMD